MLIKITENEFLSNMKRQKKGQKRLKIHNIYNINHNKGMTSKLIWTIDNFGIGEGFKMY